MSESNRSARRLTSFYREMSTLDSIMRTLAAERVNTKRLKPRDLYSRGLDTQNLGGIENLEHIAGVVAEYGAPERGEQVLDIACGIGGPGRLLADRFRCRVTGIDLLPLRIETARALTKMTGLADRISYRVADATALPFKDRSIAQAWMLDASIHVRKKEALFGEIARVLRPGGLLVLHDQLGPLPKAMEPVMRRAPYIAPTLPQLLRYAEDAGMAVLTWRDTTARVLEHFHQTRKRRRAGAGQRPGSAKRQAKRLAALNAYIETFERHGGRCGLLIARRVA